MQLVIYDVQNTTLEINNFQNSAIIQNVNAIGRTFDYFHNLSSIKDFLEIFTILLLLIIIISYIYKRHKNNYL
ncbi:MAG: hypothetical protein ACO2ON_03865 [Candidatus Nanopusillus sp.]